MTRNELVERTLGVAEECATRFIARLPRDQGIDEDGIRGASRLALVQAAGRFNPEAGTTFASYAWPRLWGAMQDELRDNDHLNRNDRTVHKTVAHLTVALRRPPTDEETAEACGLSVERVQDARGRQLDRPLRLDQPTVNTDGEELWLLDGYGGSGEFDDVVCDTVAVREALKTLPPRHRTILSLYFDDDLTMQDIGEMFGVTESRVSQIVSTSVLKLRRELQRVPQPAVRRAAA